MSLRKPLPPVERWLLALALCLTFAVILVAGLAQGHPPSANQNNCAGPGRTCAASTFIGHGLTLDGGSFGQVSTAFLDAGLINVNTLTVGGGGVTSDGGIISINGGMSAIGTPPLAPAGSIGMAMGNVSSFGAFCFANSSGYSLSTCQLYTSNSDTFINALAGAQVIFRVNNVTKASVDGTYGLLNAINVGTAGSGTGITTSAVSAVRQSWSVQTVARTALTNAATTQDVTIWTVPAKTRVRAIIADGTAAFDDGAGPISALTMTCGKTAGGAEYLVSGSLFTVNTLGDATGEVGASLNTYFGDIPSWSATTAIQCRFTSTGGNLSTLTTGSVTFYLSLELPP